MVVVVVVVVVSQIELRGCVRVGKSRGHLSVCNVV